MHGRSVTGRSARDHAAGLQTSGPAPRHFVVACIATLAIDGLSAVCGLQNLQEAAASHRPSMRATAQDAVLAILGGKDVFIDAPITRHRLEQNVSDLTLRSSTSCTAFYSRPDRDGSPILAGRNRANMTSLLVSSGSANLADASLISGRCLHRCKRAPVLETVPPRHRLKKFESVLLTVRS